MEIVRGDYFFVNGNLAKAFQINEYLQSGSIQIYEVLRVINSKPIFFNDHIERLKLSISGIGEKLLKESAADLIEDTKKVIDVNRINEGNIKILIQFINEKIQTLIYFIPHFYPRKNDYKNGVDVGLFIAKRENPNVKRVNSIRETIDSLTKKNNFYEVLLVDENNEITEGSRTNVFFIDQQGNITTAPDYSVLKGITRKYAIEICKEKEFSLNFKKINIEHLTNYQSAFLTGTSPKILPIKKIENTTFEVNSPILRGIMECYEDVLNKRSESI